MAARKSDVADPFAPPKPKSDAYVGVLIVSLLAMLVGCVFLFLDYNSYPDGKAPKVTTLPGGIQAAPAQPNQPAPAPK
jgi:hypothetical protein